MYKSLRSRCKCGCQIMYINAMYNHFMWTHIIKSNPLVTDVDCVIVYLNGKETIRKATKLDMDMCNYEFK